jgi:hypothetical protein
MADELNPTQTPDSETIRAPRAQNTREKAARPKAWRPPETLPMPDEKPGWAHRWIRAAMRGEADVANVSAKRREGWEPCKAQDYPELALSSLDATSGGRIEVGGLILCRIPAEFMRQRDEYYHGVAKTQVLSMDNHYLKDGDQDARMPRFADRRTQVSFGNGS